MKDEPKPAYEVNAYLNARDNVIIPYSLKLLGLKIKAWSSDHIQIEPQGSREDFPLGSWTTVEDLAKFCDELQKIVDELEGLEMAMSHGVNILRPK
jgi:hypothetical protein